jgi:hypothetical protein
VSGFPTHPDAMTSDWLALALGAPAGTISGFSVAPVGTGQMCDSFRLTLDWADSGRRPATVIAKCPSADPHSRAIAAQLGGYRLEVSFYQRLAAHVAVARPHCHFAAIADNDVDFLLLFDDLYPARQGDQLSGASPAQIDAAVDQAAALHASLWADPMLDGETWLHRDTRPLVKAMFPALYQGFRDRYDGILSRDVLDLGAEIIPRLDAYLDRTPDAPTLVHGDMRVDNILFSSNDESAWLLDWQTCAVGSGATDLAYLIGTSVADPVERAATDVRGFARWIAGLEARGTAPDPDALWRDYRIGALSGYFMAVFASMSVERTDRGDAMFAVMAERPARQALELESLGLL